MDLKLSEEQRLLQEMVSDFAKNEVQPKAEHIDRSGEFPQEIIKKAGELGLMGVEVPTEWDGAGMDALCYAIVIEELSAANAGVGVIASAHNSLCVSPIMKFGTDAQKEKYLKPLARGELIGCLGLTEPMAGSDAGAVKTKAELKGDKWILNGTKLFITNGKEAGVSVIIARTEEDQTHRGLSAFIVPKGAPGFTLGKEEEKLGIHGSSTMELIFENCEIPKDHLLGARAKGFGVAMYTLDGGRIGIAAQAVGIARAAYEASVGFAKERFQFGKPIASFQAIQWMVANMATEIDAARLLVWRAAWKKLSGQNYSQDSAMAKLYAAEVAQKAVVDAVQVHGGYGYVKDYPVERYYRDAKITSIYEGTSEVQRIVIANNIFKDVLKGK
jgi:butyryl-CoA dehydrogenase